MEKEIQDLLNKLPGAFAEAAAIGTVSELKELIAGLKHAPFPVEEMFDYWWNLDKEEVLFAKEKENVFNESSMEDHYENSLLEPAVIHHFNYVTVIGVYEEPNVQELYVFDNEKEVKSVEDVKKPAEKPPAIGNIQLKDGKAQIMTEDGLVKFDVDYVIGLMRDLLKKVKPICGVELAALENYIKLLKDSDNLEKVMKRLKVLSSTRGCHGEFLMGLHELLSKIKMFKNIRTAPPEDKKEAEPVKEQTKFMTEILPKLDLPEELKGLPISNHTEDLWHLHDDRIYFGRHDMWAVDTFFDKDYTVVCVEYTGNKVLLVFDNTKEGLTRTYKSSSAEGA